MRSSVKGTKVLHIIDSLDVGGTEKRCLEIMAGTARFGFEPFLIYFRGNGPLLAELDMLGIAHRQVPMGRFGSRPFWQGVHAIARHIRDSGTDLVQAYGFYSNVPGILAGRMAGRRAIIASRRDMGEFLTPAQDMVERWLWRWARRVVVNATAIKRSLTQVGVPEAKVVVVHNGIDLATIPVPESNESQMTSGPVVGMVASLRHQKDHRTFLDAAALVAARYRDVRFVLAGIGPLEAEIRAYARDLGLTDRVNFAGLVSGPAIGRLFKSLTVSVLTSKCNEGLPNVVLESMAHGKPVVATDVGGTADAVKDGETGFLVTPGQPAVLADKIMWLLDHPTAAVGMGEQGRRLVEERFSLREMQDRVAGVYAALLREPVAMRGCR